MLVDVAYLISGEDKKKTEHLRAQYVVHVADVVEVLLVESFEESPHPLLSLVFPLLGVDGEEVYASADALKEWGTEGSRHDGHVHVGVLLRHLPHDGSQHGHVAEGGESDNQ